jgi:hypothetical protein
MLFALFLAVVLPAQAKKPPEPPPPPVVAVPALDPSYEADIRKLLEVTGSAALAQQAMDQMMVHLKTLVPNAPEEFWTEFRASANPSELVDMMVPIYAKYFTHEDILALLAFYDTPAGKKLIASQPAILHESMAAGAAWGQRVASDVMMRLEAQKAGSSEGGRPTHE